MTGLPRDARWTFGSALILLVMAASTHSVPAWSQTQNQVLPASHPHLRGRCRQWPASGLL